MNFPTQLTLLRILLTPVFVLLLFLDSTSSRIGAFIVFTVAALTDWYDGYAARKFGDVSMWGKFRRMDLEKGSYPHWVYPQKWQVMQPSSKLTV